MGDLPDSSFGLGVNSSRVGRAPGWDRGAGRASGLMNGGPDGDGFVGPVTHRQRPGLSGRAGAGRVQRSGGRALTGKSVGQRREQPPRLARPASGVGEPASCLGHLKCGRPHQERCRAVGGQPWTACANQAPENTRTVTQGAGRRGSARIRSDSGLSHGKSNTRSLCVPARPPRGDICSASGNGVWMPILSCSYLRGTAPCWKDRVTSQGPVDISRANEG